MAETHFRERRIGWSAGRLKPTISAGRLLGWSAEAEDIGCSVTVRTVKGGVRPSRLGL